VLGLSASATLDPQRPLNELGLDSLMAIELRNILGRAIDRRLPATLLFKAPSVEALTDAVLEELGEPTAVETAPEAADEMSELGQLSDEEVADGLAAEFEALARKGWAD
jgi:acyl carrier protein